MTVSQLPLLLSPSDPRDFASFQAGANAELLAHLRDLMDARAFSGSWLWGAQGVGRSHLLEALCHEAGARGQRAAYLPLRLLASQADVLDGPAADLIAVDDVDVWLGERELEAGLVGLYQRQLTADGKLVFSCSGPAARQTFAVADLASRLRGLPSYQVFPLDDAGLQTVLAAAARRRGLELSQSVAEFWLARSRRTLPVLLDELERLDGAALAGRRGLTIPLLKEVLDL